MSPEPVGRKHIGAYIPPWLLVGAVTILTVIVVVFSIRNINREKRYMSQILSEKGAALIKAFESGARTGMIGMMWGGDQVQTLLEETARQADILYLVVTDKTGVILAHSDRAEVGQKFYDDQSLTALNPGIKEKWRLTDHGADQRAFEVYRFFRPLADCDPSTLKRPPGGMGRRMMMGMRGGDWCSSWRNRDQQREVNDQIIFVGLDRAPFEEARSEDIRNTVIISCVLLLLGFGGFLSLFWIQNYKTTKRLLQDTSAFAEDVVANLPVGLITVGKDGRIAFLNEPAEKITGLTLDEVRGKEPDKVLPRSLCGLKESLEKGQTILEKEMECVFTNDKPVPLSISAKRIVNEDGYFVGNILILRDLGELRKLQEDIRRKEKLAALGGLAAGVAHEIRNPLSSIKVLATYFGKKFPEGSEDQESATVMVSEVDRLNRVISELLEFARPSDLELKETDVNELLEHSVRLTQQDAKTKGIEIILTREKKLPSVLIDPDRFTQAILNLYLNAIHSMDEGGILSVRTMLVDPEQIAIEVRDTGKGIQPEDLAKVFEPYFTTKPTGTGLGLAIVHKIVEVHNGDIKVESSPEKGTVFTIFIPIQNGHGGGHNAQS